MRNLLAKRKKTTTCVFCMFACVFCIYVWYAALLLSAVATRVLFSESHEVFLFFFLSLSYHDYSRTAGLSLMKFCNLDKSWQPHKHYWISRSLVRGRGHMGFGMFCVAATRGCINMYLNKLIVCQGHRSKVKIICFCVCMILRLYPRTVRSLEQGFTI